MKDFDDLNLDPVKLSVTQIRQYQQQRQIS